MSQRDHKPIYERVGDILASKEEYLHRKREEKMTAEAQSMRPFLTPKKKSPSPNRSKSLIHSSKADRIQNRHMRTIDVVLQHQEEKHPMP